MTITNQNAYTNDASNWVHTTFIVSLGVSYKTYLEVLSSASQDERYSNTSTAPALEAGMAQVLSAVGDTMPSPVYYSLSKCRDTSLGGNDVINAYYGYNEDDDVSHPFHYVGGQTSSVSPGMGRVYSETIDDHQQILYMSFGIPEFNSLSNFYENAANANLAKLMQQGIGSISGQSIGLLIGSTVGTLVSLPRMALLWLDSSLAGGTATQITKYYDFKSQMAMYYKFVQTILVHLSVNMNFMNDQRTLEPDKVNPTNTTGSVTQTKTSGELSASEVGGNGAQGIPDTISQYNMDIAQIIMKKYKYQNKGKTQIKSTDQMVQDQAGKDINAPDVPTGPVSYIQTKINDFFYSAGATLQQENLFIGFKVEKGVDTSESLSNQTGPSEVESTINSNLQAERSKKFSIGNGKTGFAPLDFVAGVAGGLLSGLASGLGLGGLSALATGSGMIDIPEIWQNSAFSKNYSFRMQLRSPYGDPISILHSVYVPLACLLAAALPRAIGPASYTSPFLLRAYCRGMFAVPLGMIDSISINRGGDQHGWSAGRLPTAVDVSFTIKDLSPAMYMAIGDSRGLFDQTLGANTSFQEYLATLAGLGIYERLNWRTSFARRTQIFLQTLWSVKFNSNMLGMTFGSTPIMRRISAILPTTRLLP